MQLRRMLYPAIGLVALGLVLVMYTKSSSTPEATVKKLADWYLKDGFEDTLTALLEVDDAKAVFDPAIIILADKAKAERERQSKAHPDLKPDFANNTFITGFQDAVDQYQITETLQSGDTAQSQLAWRTLGDRTFDNTKVLLHNTPEGWRITDIIYDEDYPSERLTEELKINHQ